jgi:enoyl-CoA hydratase/carnithine racemase
MSSREESARALAAVDSYVDSSVLVITLADGRGGNRLNPALFHAFAQALAEARQRTDVRALLIRSNGPAFCHGMDLPALKASGWDLEAIDEAVGLYTELLLSIHTLPKPVVAVIEGDVKAGGVGLAAACDAVIGTPAATFEMAEVFFGIIPANVLPFLVGARISEAKARYLVLSAKKVQAEEALRLGLLDELFAPEELEKKVKDLLKRFLSFSPAALAEGKALCTRLGGRDLPALLELTRQTLGRLLRDPAVQKAIDAFLEGGLPSWSERFKPARPLLCKE